MKIRVILILLICTVMLPPIQSGEVDDSGEIWYEDHTYFLDGFEEENYYNSYIDPYGRIWMSGYDYLEIYEYNRDNYQLVQDFNDDATGYYISSIDGNENYTYVRWEKNNEEAFVNIYNSTLNIIDSIDITDYAYHHIDCGSPTCDIEDHGPIAIDNNGNLIVGFEKNNNEVFVFSDYEKGNDNIYNFTVTDDLDGKIWDISIGYTGNYFISVSDSSISDYNIPITKKFFPNGTFIDSVVFGEHTKEEKIASSFVQDNFTYFFTDDNPKIFSWDEGIIFEFDIINQIIGVYDNKLYTMKCEMYGDTNCGDGIVYNHATISETETTTTTENESTTTTETTTETETSTETTTNTENTTQTSTETSTFNETNTTTSTDHTTSTESKTEYYTETMIDNTTDTTTMVVEQIQQNDNYSGVIALGLLGVLIISAGYKPTKNWLSEKSEKVVRKASKRCPACGEEIFGDFKFCTNCGVVIKR